MTSWLLWLNPTVNAILVRSVKRGGRLRQRQVFNRQGQAHIVSTATASPDPRCAPGAGVRLRTWFSIDPQPASINPTINISIVFICAFLVDCGRIIRHSGNQKRVLSDPAQRGGPMLNLVTK